MSALANAHLSSVLANLSAGVMVFDTAFALHIANPSAAGILRTDTGTLLGRAVTAWPRLAEFGAVIREEFASHGETGWQREVDLAEHSATLLIRGSVRPGGGYIVVFDEFTQLIAAQRAYDTRFAVYRMGTLQNGAHRLPSQHIASTDSRQQVGRI